MILFTNRWTHYRYLAVAVNSRRKNCNIYAKLKRTDGIKLDTLVTRVTEDGLIAVLLFRPSPSLKGYVIRRGRMFDADSDSGGDVTSPVPNSRKCTVIDYTYGIYWFTV